MAAGKIEKDIEVCSLYSQRKRCFGVTKLDKIFKWLDASYAVNHDLKRQTGSVVSMGLGVTHCRSSKQKLNTKTSTEA